MSSAEITPLDFALRAPAPPALAPAEEALGPAREAAGDAPLVRVGGEPAALGRVRHEAGLDEHDGDVRPVEPRQVAAAEEAEAPGARPPHHGPLEQSGRAQA